MSFFFVLGTIVTALFSRGPWLYIRINSNGKTGYIPRIICSLYHNQMISSIDSSLIKDNTKLSSKNEKYFHRYLSHSSAIINDSKQPTHFDERERRNTYTLPRQPRSKDRRLTLNSINIFKQNSQNNLILTRDTDSSSTQDSGYSESTPFFLVQQATPDTEQPPVNSLINISKVCLNKQQSFVLEPTRTLLINNSCP
jgi:hypothetical protein